MPRTVVTPTAAFGIEELYAHAERELAAGRAREAAVEFLRAYDLDPDGPLAASARLSAGSALERAGDFEQALSVYRQIVGASGELAGVSPSVVDVAGRRALLVLSREDQESHENQELTEELLANLDEQAKGPLLSVLVAATRALRAVAAGDLEHARRFVGKGQATIDAGGFDVPGRIPLELGLLYFARGEVLRSDAEAIRFEPRPTAFPQALERRCRHLLDAQGAYSDAMRAFDPHWSVLAGTRVASLYERLHQDLMRVEPPGGSTADRELFEGAMRLRYSVLLRKASALLEHTLALGLRSGASAALLQGAKETQAAVQRSLAAEEAALARLPYSREVLGAAFERMRSAPRAP